MLLNAQYQAIMELSSILLGGVQNVIDYSNEIFNTVAVGLRSAFEGIKVVGEYVSAPSHFPTVTLDETQNVPVHLDSASYGKYARVQYRAQIFTNGGSVFDNNLATPPILSSFSDVFKILSTS